MRTAVRQPSGPVSAAPSPQAAEAVALVHENAERAQAAALCALELALAGGDHISASVAERALGLAYRETGDIAESVTHFRRAITLGRRAGSPPLVAEARVGLLSAHAIAGRFDAAIREGKLAAAVLRGPDLARVQTQMATVLRLQGRLDDALALYRTALHGLRGEADPLRLASLYNNRAVTYYHRGNLVPALADFERAEELLRNAGHRRLAARARQSWGIVMARRGDLPAALAAFAQADEYLGANPSPDPLSLRDRAIVLLAARLVEEAHDYLQRAVAQLEAGGEAGYLAEARLLLAEAALFDGQPSVAGAVAEQARQAFVAQKRPAWAALARALALRAAWNADECSPALLVTARRTADDLAAAGFLIRTVDARLLAGRIALAVGQLAVARRELEATASARRRGPVELRAAAWHAEALLRLQMGNRRGARSALNAGMSVLDRYRAAQGATDLRVRAAGHGEELAALGSRLAFEDGDACRILAWSERCRALSLRPRPVRPPRDARLAADLTELRQVVTEATEAALAGRPTARLVARQAALEDRVRDRAREAGGPGHVPSTVPSRAALRDALGERALVEIVEHAGVLHAVVVVGGRLRLRSLAPRGEVEVELERVRFSLRRLAMMGASPASVDTACRALEYGLKRLDGLLLDPVAADVGDRELVVVPTGALHAVPWPALPSLGWRPVAVAPSSAVWHAAATSPSRGEAPPGRSPRVVLVAGPDLPAAAREVAALARRHPGAERFTGSRATSSAVVAALDGADLAHVAAHGRFRADNPLFSSLQLADGPLTVYDLEGLARAPTTLILSACDSGLSDVRPGDELMGLAASLLSLGTRTVVATTCPVPDDATRAMMLAVHAGLGRGLRPAEALSQAQRRAAGAASCDLVTAAAFVCFGVG